MARDRYLQLSIGLSIAVPASLALAQEGHEQDTHAADDHAADTHAQDGHADDTHVAHDDGHGGDHEVVGAIPTKEQGIATGVTALLVFILVLAVLGAKVWPAISKGLDERAAKIKGEIEAAENARKQAKDALESYERSLSEARAEAQQMLDQARADQQKLAAELKAKADAELSAMKEKAKREIESAKRAAVGEIYNEAANLATSVAGKILGREINASDQQRLVEEAVSELAAAGR
ncbi:MAG: F0F1 ATP synthase subunit B [Phycisphaerales bacterium]|nr:F0F1 ATP synthase subunit B [Phycisphaerales bacterium]MCB9836578.1 F0F1 ATP synthase subunit B [Phycisphaera sp.]